MAVRPFAIIGIPVMVRRLFYIEMVQGPYVFYFSQMARDVTYVMYFLIG